MAAGAFVLLSVSGQARATSDTQAVATGDAAHVKVFPVDSTGGSMAMNDEISSHELFRRDDYTRQLKRQYKNDRKRLKEQRKMGTQSRSEVEYQLDELKDQYRMDKKKHKRERRRRRRD